MSSFQEPVLLSPVRAGGAAVPGGLGRAQHGPAHPPPDRPRHLQREPARLHQAQDQTQEEAQVRAW
jgi:hypothetical protein